MDISSRVDGACERSGGSVVTFMGCTTLWFSLSLLLQMTARYAVQGTEPSLPFLIVLRHMSASNCATECAGGSFTTLKTDIEDHAKRLPRLSNKQMANSLYVSTASSRWSTQACLLQS